MNNIGATVAATRQSLAEARHALNSPGMEIFKDLVLPFMEIVEDELELHVQLGELLGLTDNYGNAALVAAVKALVEQKVVDPTDEQIDAVCGSNRHQRWRGDGRQYDRETVRLALQSFAGASA